MILEGAKKKKSYPYSVVLRPNIFQKQTNGQVIRLLAVAGHSYVLKILCIFDKFIYRLYISVNMSISGLLHQPTKPSTVTTISFASAGSVSYSQYHIIFPFKSYSLLQVYIDTGLFIALYDLRGRRAPAGALHCHRR